MHRAMGQAGPGQWPGYWTRVRPGRIYFPFVILAKALEIPEQPWDGWWLWCGDFCSRRSFVMSWGGVPVLNYDMPKLLRLPMSSLL